MDVKSYWDYTEKERSLLTQEQIEGLLEVELMQKGVKKPVIPVLRKIEDIALNKDRFFKVGSVCFKKHEEAEQFLKLNPLIEEYKWDVSSDYKFPEPINMSISEEFLYRKDEIDSLRMVLAKKKEAKEYNEKVSREYRESCKLVTETVGSIWKDWNDCNSRLEKHKRVLDTWKDYMRITYNNNEMALTFLKKAYSEAELNSAREWLGEESFNLTIPQEELGARKLIMETIKEGDV